MSRKQSMSRKIVKIPLGNEISSSTAEDINLLKKDLDALGVHLAFSGTSQGGTLSFEYDDEAHKRNAGRKKKDIPADSELAKKTQEQMDAWLLQASIDAIQEELGVARATAYRRVSEARSRVEYAIVPFDDEKRNGESS